MMSLPPMSKEKRVWLIMKIGELQWAHDKKTGNRSGWRHKRVEKRIVNRACKMWARRDENVATL